MPLGSRDSQSAWRAVKRTEIDLYCEEVNSNGLGDTWAGSIQPQWTMLVQEGFQGQGHFLEQR